MVNFFEKVGYNGLMFLNKTNKWVNESYGHKVNVRGYSE